MREKFDFYEYVGLIAPGAVLLVGLLYLFPDLRGAFSKEGVTLGEFGLFLLIAYVGGHLVQGVGNAVEWVWWGAWRGWPSDWARTGRLLPERQRAKLLAAINERFGYEIVDLEAVSEREWSTVTRQVYASVSSAGRAGRVDIFNGNYGLNRGVGAACLVLLVVAVGAGKGWLPGLVLAAAAAAALQRMHRFGRHYARELFVQFIGLPRPTVRDAGSSPAV